MKTFKYIYIVIVVLLFTGCVKDLKSVYFNEEGDRNYKEGSYLKSVESYKKAALNGNAYAYYRLYEIYKYGKYGVKRDINLSNEMIKKAVELGDYRAEYIYSLRFLYSSNPNIEKAINLLKSSAKKEYPYAYLELGHLYLYGYGVEQDKERAIGYYRLANSFGLKTPDVNSVKTKVLTKKEIIRKIQSNLKKLGFYNSSIDGITGPMTRKAISSFQRYYDYPIDTKASQKVLEQIKRELR